MDGDLVKPVDLLDGAITQTRTVLAGVTPDELDRPTPCTAWNLRALLNHVAGRAVLSTRAAGGVAVTQFPDAAGDLLGAEPATTVIDLLRVSLEAWHAAPSLEVACVTPLGEMPAAALVTFQAQDVFVHGWDIAHATGQRPAFDPPFVEIMLGLHHQTITPDLRAAFFAPAVAVDDNAAPLEQLVAFLGRQP